MSLIHRFRTYIVFVGHTFWLLWNQGLVEIMPWMSLTILDFIFLIISILSVFLEIYRCFATMMVFLVVITLASDRCIHAMVKVHNELKSFLLSAIHASPQVSKRFSFVETTWGFCKKCEYSMGIITRRFKLGGLPVNLYRVRIFQECLDKCGLMNLGLSGPRYTWTSKHSV